MNELHISSQNEANGARRCNGKLAQIYLGMTTTSHQSFFLNRMNGTRNQYNTYTYIYIQTFIFIINYYKQKMNNDTKPG